MDNNIEPNSGETRCEVEKLIPLVEDRVMFQASLDN
jgi:hypothetical protein